MLYRATPLIVGYNGLALANPVEVIMSSRFAFLAFAAAGAFALAVSPAVACDRHQHHSTSISESASATPPQPSIEPQRSTVVVLPSAAAAMSVTEALGSEPSAMRCYGRKSLQQALTQ
jgi:uncharacterized protein (DUF1684 family)